MAQVLPETVPRTTWKQEFRSVRIGDVGHIIYKGAYGRDGFRLCRISDVHPDVHGVLRTCIVEFRPRHVADNNKTYMAKEPVSMKVRVHRVAILLPVEEQ